MSDGKVIEDLLFGSTDGLLAFYRENGEVIQGHIRVDEDGYVRFVKLTTQDIHL